MWNGGKRMKIALASAPVRNRDLAYNMEMMIHAMEAFSAKADVMVFGESVLQGFDALCWNYEMDRQMAVSISDGVIAQMCNAAKRCDIAVSFGFIERAQETLYSSQIFIGADGEIVDLFHRVSKGWKPEWVSDDHYREGRCFQKFCYRRKTFATGLCGDLWTDARPKEMRSLSPDVVLWPVWCDYAPEEWDREVKYEYARQASLCGRCVLLVNPYCEDRDGADRAPGGGAFFQDGEIIDEAPAGEHRVLLVEI